MVKCKGIITLQDGVSQLNNPDINIYVCGQSKFVPTYGVAQAGKLIAATETTPESFQTITNIGGEDGSWNVLTINPDFDEVQAVCLTNLKALYPKCTFTLIA